MVLSLFIGLLATQAVTPGAAQMLITPLPVFVAPPRSGMAYYLMQGNRIISQPYKTVTACTAALAKVKGTMQPGTDTIVCAHRAP